MPAGPSRFVQCQGQTPLGFHRTIRCRFWSDFPTAECSTGEKRWASYIDNEIKEVVWCIHHTGFILILGGIRLGSLKRKQIYLDEESERALKRLAVSTKTSEAEHIRRAIKNYIAKQKVDKDTEADPLQELIGLCDDPNGPRDAAAHHDKYLYGKQG